MWRYKAVVRQRLILSSILPVPANWPVKNFTIGDIDLPRLSQMVAHPPPGGRIDLAALTGGATDFTVLDGAFAVKQGVVTLSPLTLDTAVAKISAPTTINFPLWSLDMASTVTLTAPANAPPLTISFRGPLDQPVKTFGGGALLSYAPAGTPLAPSANTLPQPAAAPIVVRSADSPSVKTMATPLIAPHTAMLPMAASSPASGPAPPPVPVAAPMPATAPAAAPPATATVPVMPTPVTVQPSVGGSAGF